MSDTPKSGELFGIPYNFERPSLGRLLSSYWQPDEGMLVEKPFGVGYTLNLADWRAWVILLVAGGLYYQQIRSGSDDGGGNGNGDGDDGDGFGPGDDAVEVVVDD